MDTRGKNLTMDIGAVIALASGIGGLIATLWKVFNIIRQIERQIDKLANEQEIQELTLNGTREKLEHTRDRLLTEMSKVDERVNCAESWLTKHTEFNGCFLEPRSKR